VRLSRDRSNIDSGGGHHQLDDVRRLFVCLTTEGVKFIQGFKKHRAIELNWAGSAKPRPIRIHGMPPKLTVTNNFFGGEVCDKFPGLKNAICHTKFCSQGYKKDMYLAGTS
jgi:hypothetical protein